MKLNDEERKAVAALKRLAAKWPKNLWLFSASGELHVMKKRGGKRVVLHSGGMDQDCVVASVNIENDGGDW